MMLVDTHCHIHESEYFTDNREEVYQRSRQNNVVMVCASTSVQSSVEAIDFCTNHDGCYPLLGIHPHDAAREDVNRIGELLQANKDNVTGIGEIGLDYYYQNSPRESQIAVFEQQLQWAVEYNLPVSFHVRDEKASSGTVWADFWPILDNFPGIQGVLHSFTDSRHQLERGFERGLYVGVNGISTFTRDAAQQAMYAQIPLDKLLLETDAPFLTPAPLRGTMNEPSFVGRVAEHMATVRGLSLSDVVAKTTDNARRLFNL